MVNYECYRCGYSTNDKTKIKYHLRRKNICKNIISNINIDESFDYIISGLSFEEFNKKHCEKKRLIFDSKSQHSCSNLTQFDSKNVNLREKKEKEFECKYCEKIFTRKNNLVRHYKSCKEKIKSEEVNHSMKELINIMNKQLNDVKKELSLKDNKYQEELEKRDKQIDELIKKAGITNNINIQNNYKLLSYNDTDISHLSDKDIRNCIEHNNLCIPHLVKKVHFNPKKPENHNIYISNIKNNYAMKYDGGQWNLENQDEAIEILIDDKQLILEQKLEEWIETGKEYPDIMAKFNRYLEKKEKDDVLNTIKEEIKLILFNNREIIKKS